MEETAAASSGNSQAKSKIFSLRITDVERRQLRANMLASEMPWPTGRPSLGHFLIWAGLTFKPRQLGGLDVAPAKRKPARKPRRPRVARAKRRGRGRGRGKGGRK